MRFKTTLIALAMLAMSVAVASESGANSLTFQNVTFDLLNPVSGTLQLNISNALNANGDWEGITDLANFEVKNLGGSIGTLSLTDWTGSDTALSGGNGCSNGNSPNGSCFTPKAGPFPLSNSFGFNIGYSGTLDLTAPHLKVRFFDSDGKKQGELLSQDIHPNGGPNGGPNGVVPEPSTVLSLGIGLVGLAVWCSWQRKRRTA